MATHIQAIQLAGLPTHADRPSGGDMAMMVRAQAARVARRAMKYYHAYASTRDIPDVTITLTDSINGRAIRLHLNSRKRGIRTRQAVAVLDLPTTVAAYLSGKKRQAVRTNLTKGNQLGLFVQKADAGELAAAVTLAADKGSAISYLDVLLKEAPTAHMDHWIGRSSTGAAAGFARVRTDGDVAWLKYLCVSRSPDFSALRYVMTVEIIRDLIDRGIRYLIVDSVIELDEGLAYFQGRLGFSPRRATIATAPSIGLQATTAEEMRIAA